MDVRCPQCNQRLRYPDGLSNPTLRCRSCGTVFQAGPLADDEIVEASTAESDFTESAPVDPTASQPVSSPTTTLPTSSQTSSSKKRSWGGTAGLIVLVILFRVGSRLFREFNRERPPQPVPQPVEAPGIAPQPLPQPNGAELERIMRELQKAERQAEEQQNKNQPIRKRLQHNE